MLETVSTPHNFLPDPSMHSPPSPLVSILILHFSSKIFFALAFSSPKISPLPHPGICNCENGVYEYAPLRNSCTSHIVAFLPRGKSYCSASAHVKTRSRSVSHFPLSLFPAATLRSKELGTTDSYPRKKGAREKEKGRVGDQGVVLTLSSLALSFWLSFPLAYLFIRLFPFQASSAFTILGAFLIDLFGNQNLRKKPQQLCCKCFAWTRHWPAEMKTETLVHFKSELQWEIPWKIALCDLPCTIRRTARAP